MDRIREGRRGGGPVRRPRSTGFKDSSVVDDDDMMEDAHNSRLRERSKKESSSMSSQQGGGVFSTSTMSGSRNKRKRAVPHEVQVQARSTPADEMDETTEDTEMGASEDDDDLPPPPISRRPGKLRLQGKSLDEGSAVDISAVPRKARTAFTKRPQESPPTLVGDSPRRQSLATAAPSSVPISTAPSSSNAALKPGRRTKPSGIKPRASKLAKVSTPSTISEQEVEVAEALFDLARMVPNQGSPSVSESKLEAKPESNPEPKFLASTTTSSPPAPVSSPAVTPLAAQACIPTSPISGPPVSSPTPIPNSSSAPMSSSSPVAAAVPAPAEAPKRKRPRVRPKIEGGTTTQPQPGSFPAGNSGGSISDPKVDIEHNVRLAGADRTQVKSEVSTMGSNGSTMVGIGSPHTSAAMAVPTPLAAVPWPPPAEKKPLVIGDKKSPKSDPSCINPVEKAPTPARTIENKNALSVASSPGSSVQQIESGADRELPDVGVSSTKLELGKRLPQSPASDSAHHGKLEIDLMAPPKALAAVTNERTGNDRDSVAWELNEKAQKDPAIAPSKSSWFDKESVKDERDDGESNIDNDKNIGDGGVSEQGKEQMTDMDLGRQGEKEAQRENSKEREREKEKVEFPKQPSQRMGKNVKSDSRLPQKSERSAGSSFLVSPPSTSSGATGSITGPSLPISMGMAGWPGSLPHLGYYSPAAAAAAAAAVAAAWPAAASINGAAPVDENGPLSSQVPPFVFPGARQPYKRCATHVYIAHFIDAQQQMQRHPLWAATYGNTAASLYGTKPYNLNIPLPPAETMFVNGAGGSKVTAGGSSVGPGGRGSGLALGSLKERGLGSSANSQGSKERVPSSYMDALARKAPSQQPAQAAQQQQSLSLQAGPGLAFGFPVTQAVASSMCSSLPGAVAGNHTGTGGSANLIGSSAAGNTAVIVSGSGSVVGPPVGTSNGNVVNAAAAQVQYLLQQTGFPFSFPPAHFAGHITQQQATQFPFYNTHLVHPPLHSQQGQPAAGSTTSGISSSQKQYPLLQQGARNIQSSGSPQQQQQQQQPPSPLPSQPQQQHSLGTPSQQLQRSSDREGNMGGETGSSAESKFSALQRNMYSQATPNMQVPSVNPSSSVLASSMAALPAHPQDFSLMAALGGKQAGKLQNHQQQASGQLQPQHQSVVSSQMQQQHLVAHHTANPALHMSLKGMDPQVSQAFSVGNMTRSSIGLGPLGLAPVAAVMAPQGHAVLQTITDHGRGHVQPSHQQLSGQPHQQHRTGLMQKAGATVVEDSRTNIDDGSHSSSNRGRDNVDDRKMPVKRALAATGQSRMELEVSPNAQGSPTASSSGGLTSSRMASSSGASVNLMASSIGNPSSRQSGLSSSGCVPGTAPPANQSFKPAMGRAKVMTNTTVALPVAANDSSLSSFTDRTLGAALNKVPASGLPFHGQSISSSSQNLRQGQVATQHTPQAKQAQRTQPATTVSTAPGSPTPAMFAAATISKHQGQQPRGQQPALNAMPGSRPPPAVSSSSAAVSIPLPPLPSVSKSSGGTVLRNTTVAKGSFNLSQKQIGATSAKRSGPVPSASILGPTPMPAKVPQSQQHQQQSQHNFQQQQQQQQQQQHQQQQQFSQSLQQQAQGPLMSAQQTMTLQYHQQQAMANQVATHALHKQSLQPQSLQIRQQFFLQQQQQQFFQQQQQQQPQSQQPQSHSSAPQQPMSHPTQQQSGQPVPQQTISSVTKSLQQHPVAHQQGLKHVHQSLQSPQTPTMPASFVMAKNGGLPHTAPTLTLGTGSGGRTMSSDGVLNQAVGSRSATPVKSSGSPGGASSQRNNNTGPNFLYSQLTASSSTISSPQQSCTMGMNSSSSPYLQTTTNSSSGGKLSDEKALAGASPGRLPPQTSGIAMNLMASSGRPPSGGSGMKNTGGRQFATGTVGGDGLTPRSGAHQSSSNSHSTGPSTANGSQNTVSQLNSDAKVIYVATSAAMHQGGGSGQHLPVSSGQPMITMTANLAASVAPSGPSVLVGQNPAGVVQP